MATQLEAADARAASRQGDGAAGLLGGGKALGRSQANPLRAHDMILRGLPAGALERLLGALVCLPRREALEKAIGISLRTWQRRKDARARPLSPEQSGRAWKFAEILAKASEIFGSQEDAERWLGLPALGLEGRRPLDLLASPAGVALVEDLLTRLEYGVYQ